MTTRPVVSIDFALGVLSAVGAIVAHKIWRVLRTPSIQQIQGVAKEPVQHVGDDEKITVVGHDPENKQAIEAGLLDFSPFVTRVEAYLRLIKQPYVKATTATMSENPRHKIPYANVLGTMVDDSSKILEKIQEKLSIKNELTEEQLVKGHLIRTLLLDSLYFVLAYAVFDTADGRKMFYEMMHERKVPSFLLPSLLQHGHENLYGQGYGRYPEEDIIRKGQADIRALSSVLGDNKFILGTNDPTMYDTDVYAFMSICFSNDVVLALNWIAEMKKETPQLVEYVERMKDILFTQ